MFVIKAPNIYNMFKNLTSVYNTSKLGQLLSVRLGTKCIVEIQKYLYFMGYGAVASVSPFYGKAPGYLTLAGLPTLFAVN